MPKSTIPYEALLILYRTRLVAMRRIRSNDSGCHDTRVGAGHPVRSFR